MSLQTDYLFIIWRQGWGTMVGYTVGTCLLYFSVFVSSWIAGLSFNVILGWYFVPKYRGNVAFVLINYLKFSPFKFFEVVKTAVSTNVVFMPGKNAVWLFTISLLQLMQSILLKPKSYCHIPLKLFSSCQLCHLALILSFMVIVMLKCETKIYAAPKCHFFIFWKILIFMSFLQIVYAINSLRCVLLLPSSVII